MWIILIKQKFLMHKNTNCFKNDMLDIGLKKAEILKRIVNVTENININVSITVP